MGGYIVARNSSCPLCREDVVSIARDAAAVASLFEAAART